MLQILTEPELSSRTSLRLGGRALAEVTFRTMEDLDSLPETLAKLGGRPVMLGGGTNILAADGQLPLVLVRCGLDFSPSVMGEDANGNLFVRVSAGMKLSRLLAWCLQARLGGLENMVGIPGTVGGAVAGNAGAQGTDIGSHVWRVNVFSTSAGLEKITWSDVTFGYRSLTFPEHPGDFPIFTGVVLSLRPMLHEDMARNYRDSIARKIHTQPLRDRSAGCIFKNPLLPGGEAVSAGKLIEEAGFKGKRQGGVCFSPLHANFLINEGSGSAQAAFDLIREAQEAVQRKHGVELQFEVKTWEC